jgi:ADP-heptose:LPS heptosyltransferase
MKIDKAKVKKILMITLSNIGDVVLTLPVLGVLKREFPEADITIITGPSARGLFEADPSVSKIIVYNKHMPFLEKITLGIRLRMRNFDMVVDLRNSLFPLFIGARYSTPLFNRRGDLCLHRKEKHLNRLTSLGISVTDAPFSIYFNRDDNLHVHSLLNESGILPEDNIVCIAAGAKSHIKRWTQTGFIRLCDRLVKETGSKVILVGDDSDRQINRQIKEIGLNEVYDLTGRTNLRELAYLFSLSKLLITNDSSPLHIASAVNTPTIAIFGPTDPKKYGPLSPASVVIRKGLKCSPCEKALCRFNLECMNELSCDDVFEAARKLLKIGTGPFFPCR